MPPSSTGSGSQDQSPPSTEAQDTDKQWRIANRGARACQACSKRKTRCVPSDNADEPCQYCSNTGISCSLAPVKGPPTTYVSALEQRLEATQQLLRNLSVTAGVDLVALADDPDGESKTDILRRVAEQMYPTQHAVTPPCPQAPLFVDGGQKGVLVYDAARYLGPAANPHMARHYLQAVAPEGDRKTYLDHSQNTSLVDSLLAEEELSASRATLSLPAPDLRDALVKLFFDKFNDPCLPLLHRSSFEQHVRDGLYTTDITFLRLLFCILGIGARWSDDPRLESEVKGLEFYRGYSTGCSNTFPTPSTIWSVISSTISVIYLLGTTNSFSAYHVVGNAIRRAVDVGVHLEAKEMWKSTVIKDQLRKRAFFSLYSLDRSISIMTGRPMAISEFDFDLSWPLSIDDAALSEWDARGVGSPAPPETPTTVAALTWNARLATIQGKGFVTLYSPKNNLATTEEIRGVVNGLEQEMQQWLRNLPEHLRWPTNDARFKLAAAQLQSRFYSAQIVIHRAVILSAAHSRKEGNLPRDAFKYGSDASIRGAELLEHLQQQHLLEQAFWWAPVLAGTSGLVLFAKLRLQRLRPEALVVTMEAVRKNYHALMTLATTCPEARWGARTYLRHVAVLDQKKGNLLHEFERNLRSTTPLQISDVLNSDHSLQPASGANEPWAYVPFIPHTSSPAGPSFVAAVPAVAPEPAPASSEASFADALPSPIDWDNVDWQQMAVDPDYFSSGSLGPFGYFARDHVADPTLLAL